VNSRKPETQKPRNLARTSEAKALETQSPRTIEP
jgi:hypothetical protein